MRAERQFRLAGESITQPSKMLCGVFSLVLNLFFPALENCRVPSPAPCPVGRVWICVVAFSVRMSGPGDLYSTNELFYVDEHAACMYRTLIVPLQCTCGPEGRGGRKDKLLYGRARNRSSSGETRKFDSYGHKA